MGRQWSWTNLWRRSPPEWAEPHKQPFRQRILRFLFLQRRRLRLRWSQKPRSWTQRPRSSRLICLFFAPQHRSSFGPVRCHHPAIYTLSKWAGVFANAAPLLRFMQLSPARWWRPQRVGFLPGEIPCVCHARWIWFFPLREHQSRLSTLADSFLFRKRFRPSRCPVFFLPGTQQGRGFQRPAESELTSAQIPRASLSPHREVYSVLFPNLTSIPLLNLRSLMHFMHSPQLSWSYRPSSESGNKDTRFS